jgi:ankyrin repeat protein
MLGHTAIVRFLLDNGVDVAASDGMTALHHASAGGHIDTMTLLLERGAPLEALNSFGGTVLSSTLWFAHNVTDEEFRRRNFPRAIKFLIAAAAKVEFYPELQREIDGMYERAARLTGQAP